jgi:hypothetical protein
MPLRIPWLRPYIFPTPEPVDDLAPVPGAAPAFVESNIPESVEACPGVGLNLVASFQIQPEGMMHVVIRYRLNGGVPEKTGPWWEHVMEAEGILDALDHFRFEYPDLGADAAALFGDDAGAFEYMYLAVDNDLQESKWPAGEGTTAQMPILPCPESEAYELHDYGISSQQAGYGPGCSPTEVTFEVILSGYGLVDEAWLRYEYLAPANGPSIVSPSFEAALQNTGEGPGYPGSTRLAVTIPVGSEAGTYMLGQDGYMSYNMYVRLTDQQVFEYPYGGPPLIEIESCVRPAATATRLILIPLFPTSTPTRPTFIILPTPSPTRDPVR